MQKNTDDIIRDLIVDFPSKGELSIYWSERMQLDLSAPYFGWGPDPWDIMDWRLTMHSGLTALMKSIAEEVVGGLKLVFFFPGQFDFARHVMEIKAPGDGVTMMNSWQRPPYDPYTPPKMDILILRDPTTLNALSERSPYIALLQDATSGQPADEAWVYFLARAETRTDDACDGEG